MKFDYLKTERLLIRRLTPDDALVISHYRSLPEVAHFQSWDVFSVAQAANLIDQTINSEPNDKGKWFQFGIELPKENRLIGDIGVLNTDDNGKCWIGFTLDSSYWNQGYAIEAHRTVLSYYSNLGILAFWASIDPRNQSSAKLLKRLNFTLLEIKPDDWLFRKQIS